MSDKPHFPYCLNCGVETRLVMGNPAFSYFLCPNCQSKFEMNVITETMIELTDEEENKEKEEKINCWRKIKNYIRKIV